MNAAQYQMMRIIQKIPTFKGFDPKEMVWLLKISHSAMYKAGQTVYELDGRSDEMLILLKGMLNVTGSAGEVLATVKPGSAIGEMGLFTGQPRSANIVALENCAALTIRKSELLTVLGNNTDMYVKLLYNLLSQLSQRLTEANQINGELKIRIEELEGAGEEEEDAGEVYASEGEEEEEEEETYAPYGKEEEEYPGDEDEDEDEDDGDELEYDKE